MKREGAESARKSKSLKLGLKDVAASSVQSNIDATYIPQFALALKGTSFHISLLSAFSGLFSPLAQVAGDRLMEKYKRKKIVLFSLVIQLLTFLAIASLGILAWKGMFGRYIIYMLLILYSVLWIFSGILYPSWFSWIGDLTSRKSRGKYFSKRNIIATLVGIVLVPVGFALDYAETEGLLLAGFAILFAIAAVSRAFSYYWISRQYEPKFRLPKSHYFSLIDFIKRFDDVGKFAVYYALFNLVLMIASPFFAVYMKESLNFSYFNITIISLSSSIFYIIFAPLMGKISDKFGNVQLFYFSTFLLSLNPLLWIFLKSAWSLSLIPQLIVGVSNAALAISATNFIFNMASPEKRALCMAYMSILAGIGTFIGAIIGGAIISFMPSSIINPFIAVFIVSGIARLGVSVGLIRKLKETEDGAKHLPKAKIEILHPLRTIHSEISLVKKMAHY